MDIAQANRAEDRAEQRLGIHTWVAIVCGLMFLVTAMGMVSKLSNPYAQVADAPVLAPLTGQIVRAEPDMCAYRSGAVFGFGGTCGAGVRMWLAGINEPIVATTRTAPQLQPAFIQPGGYAMAMVAPAALGGAREAYMLSIDGATIVQYGAPPPDRSADTLALLFLLIAPVLLYPVHRMMRQSARARSLTSQGANWGR